MIPFPFQFGQFGVGLPMGEDPYFSNVSLLLHCDGANNSTTFTDSSSSPKTVTPSGNAKISTTQSKFGGASASFDGNGDYLSSSYDAGYDFIAGDFTVETWIYFNSIKNGGRLIATSGGGGWNATNGIHFLFQTINSGGNLNLNAQISTATGTPVSKTTTGTISTGSWIHCAVSKSGTTGYISINGNVESFSCATVARPSGNPSLAIATLQGEAGSSVSALNGYMDEVRITKGVARYTANFTPPAVPFKNS